MQEEQCTGQALFDVVSSLLHDKEKLCRMSAAQKALGVPDAAQRIVDIMIELCGKGECGND